MYDKAIKTKLHHNTSNLNQTIVAVGLVFGLSMGFLEVIILSFISMPSEFMSFLLLLPSLASSILIFSLIFITLWFLILKHISRLLKLEAFPFAFSIASFIGLIFLLTIAFHQDQYYSRPEAFKIFIIVIISLIVSFSSYFALKFLSRSDKFKYRLNFLSIAIPITLAETAAFVWLYIYKIEEFFSILLLAVFVMYIFLVLLTFVLIYRYTKTANALKVLIIFSFFIFSGSLLLIPKFNSSAALFKNFKAKDHQIKHVILIIDDTLRPDFLSCYGSDNVFTPSIDQLSDNGILFRNAFSAAPWTLPSVASIMTVMSPFIHKATKSNTSLAKHFQTLAEFLYQDGYYTGAIGSNPFLTPRYKLSQGFLEYQFFPKSIGKSTLGAKFMNILCPNKFKSEISTSEITSLTINWLEKNRDKDFFIWIHYFDPHLPYTPPKKYLPNIEPPASVGTHFSALKAIRGGYFVPKTEEREWIKELYASEVKYVDENIGRLLDALDRLEIYDESLVIFTSDHGEEFWEHNGFEHGHSLYNELLHVPLILKLPGNIKSGQLNPMVTTQSLVPTVLNICGIEYDKAIFPVRSLVPYWQETANKSLEQPIFSTSLLYYENLESIITNDFKYIHSQFTHRDELYDLEQDPQESKSLISSNPEQVESARNIMAAFKQNQVNEEFYTTQETEVKIDREKIKQLKSLGYVN